jgi:excisionase family DNA binding protein
MSNHSEGPVKRAAYRPGEAAVLLGIGRTTLSGLLEAGTIRSVRAGRCRLIPASAIEEFLAGEDKRYG